MSKQELMTLAADLAAKLGAQEEGMGTMREPYYDLRDVVKQLQALGVGDEEIEKVARQ